jgi:hypothetical protein
MMIIDISNRKIFGPTGYNLINLIGTLFKHYAGNKRNSILLTFSIFSMTVLSMYEDYLTSELIAPEVHTPIKDMEGM